MKFLELSKLGAHILIILFFLILTLEKVSKCNFFFKKTELPLLDTLRDWIG